ncbi:membrane protein Mo2 [Beluga whale alphaherpesvirus 1]|uniref:Membrane protein Mo2 n=1 Tax=Beluga whale alphaherpesvirus 1 TaxID=1434720 RepID=A0A286MM98_9ALPH|nr:membrane protein Mo2 [Beluga whale alphaherpesvirus 1]YP_010084995.1 membrane protein Mo2 [Beluga whale alphaherpesvirus 1]ASW27116.1 membrane protein Mo2 [Beluga whale alphaherpesvirus 1]ASW27124.1 membrane protein Mo2 [Beluga whale alphaherpesvirus 1]
MAFAPSGPVFVIALALAYGAAVFPPRAGEGALCSARAIPTPLGCLATVFLVPGGAPPGRVVLRSPGPNGTDVRAQASFHGPEPAVGWVVRMPWDGPSDAISCAHGERVETFDVCARDGPASASALAALGLALIVAALYRAARFGGPPRAPGPALAAHLMLLLLLIFLAAAPRSAAAQTLPMPPQRRCRLGYNGFWSRDGPVCELRVNMQNVPRPEAAVRVMGVERHRVPLSKIGLIPQLRDYTGLWAIANVTVYSDAAFLVRCMDAGLTFASHWVSDCVPWPKPNGREDL